MLSGLKCGLKPTLEVASTHVQCRFKMATHGQTWSNNEVDALIHVWSNGTTQRCHLAEN